MDPSLHFALLLLIFTLIVFFAGMIVWLFYCACPRNISKYPDDRDACHCKFRWHA